MHKIMLSKRMLLASLCGFVLLAVAVESRAAETGNNSAIDTLVFSAPKSEVMEPINKEEDIKIPTNSKISVIIAKGDQLINTRLKTLNNFRAKIYAQNKNILTDEQKGYLVKMLDEQIAKLGALKMKIDAGKDATVLKQDLQSITKDYRIYAVFMPKMMALYNVQIMQNHWTVNGEYLKKAQTRLDTLKAKGKDVAAKQKILTELQATLESMSSAFVDLTMQANALVPADYPATYKNKLNDIKSGMKQLEAKFKDIRQKLKSLK